MTQPCSQQARVVLTLTWRSVASMRDCKVSSLSLWPDNMGLPLRTRLGGAASVQPADDAAAEGPAGMVAVSWEQTRNKWQKRQHAAARSILWSRTRLETQHALGWRQAQAQGEITATYCRVSTTVKSELRSLSAWPTHRMVLTLLPSKARSPRSTM